MVTAIPRAKLLTFWSRPSVGRSASASAVATFSSRSRRKSAGRIPKPAAVTPTTIASTAAPAAWVLNQGL